MVTTAKDPRESAQASPPVCHCPRCGHVGRSVAAMHYQETTVWDVSGRFTGAGVGVGTGGLGVGVMSGTMSQTGEGGTRRAHVFAEPHATSSHSAFILLMGMVVAMAFYLVPRVMHFLLTHDYVPLPAHDTGPTFTTLVADPRPQFPAWVWTVITAVSICGALVLAWKAYRMAQQEDQETDYHNATEWQRQLQRYNTLRYCSTCHTLYDTDHHAVDATASGFRYLLSL